jgi:aspartyl-tRNA(Asn)/glutamyl-tRNA(Gln) amidotransferase subunit B
MRSKEEAHDYRYFPEPDLLPLVVDAAWVEAVKRSLPTEMLAARRDRFATQYGLAPQMAETLTAGHAIADWFEAAAAASGDAKAAANWISTEVLRKLNEDKTALETIALRPATLGKLIRLVNDGVISGKIAKEIFEAIYPTGRDPEEVVREKGLVQVSDEGVIAAAIEQVIAASPDQHQKYRAGKTALLGYFVGQVIKATGGKANPALVNRLLKDRLDRP